MIEENMEMCRILYLLLPHSLPGIERKYSGPVMDICTIDRPVYILPGSPMKDPL
jgi:hypothetical protein